MHNSFQCVHVDDDDDVRFRVVTREDVAPYVALTIGELTLDLGAVQLVALRMATGQALIELKNARDARTPKLTADEDGNSLRADQYDNENAA